MVLGRFSEQSFPLDTSIIAVGERQSPPKGGESTREWLVATHQRIKHLLPDGDRAALLTRDLVRPDGGAADVFEHFGLEEERLASLRSNWNGLAHTAQASGSSDADVPPPPPWPGMRDVLIPVTGGVEIHGRLGYAEENGTIRKADCLVILPGLLGDNNVLRTRDLALGLRAKGFHVLALEFRGLGQNHTARPDIAYTFGTVETADLLAVGRWLESQPHVRQTGLIGYCWGANHALIAGFQDNAPASHPSVTKSMARFIPRSPEHRHFTAGLIAFSPVLRFEVLMERLVRPWSRFKHPAYAGLQNSIKERMKRVGYPNPDGSLSRVIDEEFARSEVNYPGSVADAVQYLRLLPHKGKPDGDKLERIRVPALIVHAANDPLAPAQDVADLIARVKNPELAAIVLPGGGHIGFAPYASRYYFSLILNFFDPQVGAAAGRDARYAEAGTV